MHVKFAELTVAPGEAVVFEPSGTVPTTFTFLECIMGPLGISLDEIESRWILPDEQVIPDEPDMGRFRVDIGERAETNGTIIPINQLLIIMVSYQDAGIYECEVRNALNPSAQWVSASVELQLGGKGTLTIVLGGLRLM